MTQAIEKIMTATEVRANIKRALDCECGKCEMCHIKQSIKLKQQAIFIPLIKRTKELLKARGISLNG